MEQLRGDTARLELGWREPIVVNAYVYESPPGSADEDGQDGGTVTLVDTGLRYNRRSLTAELRAAGYERSDVDRILLTHYDLDHVGGVGQFDRPVYLGTCDVDLVRGSWDPPLDHPKGLFHRLARKWFDLNGVDLRPVTDGDRIGGFTAHHTPGHNPGHFASVHDAGVAFVGDLLWETNGELTPPFWGDSYDMHELRRSIRAFARSAGEFEAICPGHGIPFRDEGSERLQSLADRL